MPLFDLEFSKNSCSRALAPHALLLFQCKSAQEYEGPYPFQSIIFHASEILGKEPHRKQTWVTNDVLDVCDERRDLKNKRHEAEGAKVYKEANRRIQKVVKKEKEDWIGVQ